ncbi:MAG: translation initiation factor IF-2, partial [Gammaproteobacteria bacterium]|nr:translation initiation factor IF-2 [Gammaproteobacteria bacterium]
MAHTVQSLSKLLKKSEDEIIASLADAGVDGKTATSEVLPSELKILMGSKKRAAKPVTPTVSETEAEEVVKAKAALEAGREKDAKLLAQDAKRQAMTQKQKQDDEDLKKQQIESKQE